LIRVFTVFIFLFLTSNSFSEIKKVVITGNTRVSSNTIESLVDKKVSSVDSIYINNLTKKIYDTDFFSDVKISYNQDILTIIVSENSVVNFFYINGLKDKDLDEVNKIITLKENAIFSTSKLKKDIESVKDYFRASGYYTATIDPEVIKIANNQINLILNIDKKDISKIKNIYFIGNKFFNSSQLADVISSSEDGWWKLFSSSGLNEQQIEYDKQLLRDFYKSKGFYDVQIESAFAGLDNSNNFRLIYSINSGKKYRFSNVDVQPSNTIYKEKDILEIKNISVKLLRNEDYSNILLTKLNKQITDYLDSSRYNNFEINIQEKKKADELIDILVQINQEQKVLINKINISGNAITEEKVVRDNLYLSEGDNLSNSKLKKSIDNIKSKQYFSKVEYKLEDSSVKKNAKDLNLFVKEQATGSISAGVGYGTNGALFSTSIDEKNFLGQGIGLNFTGSFSAQKLTGEFSYLDPNFKNSNKELNVSLIAQTDEYTNSGYKNKSLGSKIATKYEIYEDIYFRPNVNIQSDSLSITNISSSNLLKSRQGSTLTTSLGYNFFVDLRDSKYSPTKGSVFYFDQNIATLISDISAVQTSLGSTFYQELINEKYIGSAKIKLSNSTALNNKNIKISDRLYASQSDLRGFELRGVGPVDAGDHVGGNYLATLSLKSTFPNPVPDNLRANSYFFYDVGNVWGVDYSDIISGSSKIRSSTGIALDLMSPVGPLSFTYSIPISKASTDKEQRFLFNIGSTF
jgi:outer membrane protein insertion porin family